MKITLGQAAAFVDAIAGWESVGVLGEGEPAERAKSPIARAHLEAVLGVRGVASGEAVLRVFAYGRKQRILDTVEGPAVLALAEYLEAVAVELRAACDLPTVGPKPCP